MLTDILERCSNTLYAYKKDVRSEKQSKVVYILNHGITASFTLDIDPEMPISELALSPCNRVMVHSYAHGHH
jgi:hypothetical protein